MRVEGKQAANFKLYRIAKQSTVTKPLGNLISVNKFHF